jgi:hypothetical protein
MANIIVRHTRHGVVVYSRKHDIQVLLNSDKRIEGGIIPALFLCAPGRVQIDQTARIHTTIESHDPHKGLVISAQFDII